MKRSKGLRASVLAMAVCALALFGSLLVVTSSPALAADGVERKVKSRVAPVYPEIAKKMSISGIVKVEAVVDATGVVKSAKALGGHPILIPSAVDAVRKWRYEPSATETSEIIEIRFSN